MTTFFDDVAAFHEKFGLTLEGQGARLLAPEMMSLRNSRLLEEYEEYCNAVVSALHDLQRGNVTEVTDGLEAMLDGLVDLVYIALGTAYLHGFNFNEAWRRVHEANMLKVRAERAEQSRHGSKFDVIKPPGWKPPSHFDLVHPNLYTRNE